MTGPDYGTELRPELGIPGVNGDIRATAACRRSIGTSLHATIGGTPSWMPLFRKEMNYFSTGHHQGLPQARDARRLRLRPARAEPPPGRVRRLRPQGRLLASAATRPARPATRRRAGTASPPSCSGCPNYYAKDIQTRPDDRPREPVRVLRPRPLERHPEADPQRRPAPGVLPAHDARGQRHREARLQHLRRCCWAASATCRRTSASTSRSWYFAPRLGACTASTRTACSAPATAARSTRCPGRARCAGPTRTTST